MCRIRSGTKGDSASGITARHCATIITWPGGSFTKSTAGSGATLITGTVSFTTARGITTTSGTGVTGTSKIAITTIVAATRSENTVTNRGTSPGVTTAVIVTTTKRIAGLLMFA